MPTVPSLEAAAPALQQQRQQQRKSGLLHMILARARLHARTVGRSQILIWKDNQDCRPLVSLEPYTLAASLLL